MRCPHCKELVCTGMGVTRFFTCEYCKAKLAIQWIPEEIYLRDKRLKDKEYDSFI